MNRAQEKSQRLLQIEKLLWAHPEGLTRAEIARQLGVNRSTITKYLDAGHLPPGIYEDDFDGNKLKFDRSADLTKTAFNLHEVLALHLAARLLATRTDKQNPHAASALRKLAIALQRLDKNISQHMLRAADIMTEESAFRDPVYLDVLEKLTEAWSAGRKVKVTHQMDGGRIFEYTFAPYFIEPYAVGQTTHVFGWREPPGALRTFKIERLRSVQILQDRYEIPADFDPSALLRDAWGIWFSEGEPVEVALRFHPRVAGRVQESRWQRGQQVELQPNGYLIWRAQVAEVLEMMPWIRGWGADCEVLAPERLRNEMSRNAQQLCEIYTTVAPSAGRLPHQIPYAKTNPKNPEEVHLLLYHLIDVGQVALVMWREVLTDAIRQRLAQQLGVSVADCGRYIAFLVSLHDLGKAGPAYQKKYAPDWLLGELSRAGLILEGSGRAYDPTVPHGTVTTWALDTLLPELLGTDQRLAHKIAIALGGHHGVWPQEQDLKHISDHKHPEWEQVRRDLFSELVAVFAPPMTVTPPQDVTELNAFLTIFSGLTSVADWVGSQNDGYFSYIGQPMAARRYALDSLAKARTALNELGWIGWQPIGKAKSFAETFAYLEFGEPRPVQQQVIQAAVSQAMPTLIVIEAPTGIGKTELALYIADCWLQQHAGRGLYVAMPTQSTSNQMYTRVGEFLHQRYPDSPINFHLVHGQAAWLDELKQKVELQGVGDDGKAHLVAENWFNPRKRTLLAPFGVGTIDQALMSVLQTKHFFVRLFGLSHKVVIFDEVHAYDTYVNTIFHLLLTWLSAIGTSVIILSATLPVSTRRALVKAYTGKDLAASELVYPALTIANMEQQNTLPLPKPDSFVLSVDRSVCWEPGSISTYLCNELKEGGYAAVVCNRVRRAQEVYQLLDEARQSGELDIAADELILFHGSFLPIWRKDIEQKVLRKFGKGGARQGRAIVVATQVIEQSLDIDFDLMVTDWAPIDLLLQRAGRLHRHAVNDGNRHGIERKLAIVEPPHSDGGAPDFGKDVHVYAEYVLMRTYSALQEKRDVRIPEDTPVLIEKVYDPKWPIQLPPGVEPERMEQLWQKLEMDKRDAQTKAEKYLVLAPDRRRLLDQESLDLEEDDPGTHEMLRAQTRDIDFSITLVCLQRDDDGLYIFTENDQVLRVDLDVEPDRELVKALLQNALAIQNRSVGKYLIEQVAPHSWANNAALRYCRYAIFDQGNCDLPTHTLKLSREFGLEIIKKVQA